MSEYNATGIDQARQFSFYHENRDDNRDDSHHYLPVPTEHGPIAR